MLSKKYKVYGIALLVLSLSNASYPSIRTCLKSLMPSQKSSILEDRSAVLLVNEQRTAENRRFMAGIRDFKQALRTTAHLKASVNILALSLKNSETHPALTGNSRYITIMNTGAVAAVNVRTIIPLSALPIGTRVSKNTCVGRTLNPTDRCTITITPGAVATPDLNQTECTAGKEPNAGIISVSADNANTVAIKVLILGYGCLYQGGYVFSVDDAYADYPASGSIGGKVLASYDQARAYLLQYGPQTVKMTLDASAPLGSIIWSSNGNGSTAADVSYDLIPGIGEFSTSSSVGAAHYLNLVSLVTHPHPYLTFLTSACDGAVDGKCNSKTILAFYSAYETDALVGRRALPIDYYAAGLCTHTINGYSDWYLPAVCEMNARLEQSFCISTQNITDNLPFLIGNGIYNATTNSTPSTSCVLGANCISGVYCNGHGSYKRNLFLSYLVLIWKNI